MMSKKLNREQILHEMLHVLVQGWGHEAVQDALTTLGSKNTSKNKSTRADQSKTGSSVERQPKALMLVRNLSISEERKTILIEIATAFDSGLAFPRTSDVKSFLAAHSAQAREVRSRDHAFRLMLPILEKMSEKGLARIVSSSRHSGPAELGSISEAIKITGNDLRGSTSDVSDQSD